MWIGLVEDQWKWGNNENVGLLWPKNGSREHELSIQQDYSSTNEKGYLLIQSKEVDGHRSMFGKFNYDSKL